MGKDWAAVAAAINTRLADLGMTQKELSERSGIAVFTLRQIQNPEAYPPRRRSAPTLAAISRALRLPEDHLARVADRDAPADDDLDVRSELAALRHEVDDLRERMAQFESHQRTAD